MGVDRKLVKRNLASHTKKRGSFHKWKEGKNIIRIFPFTHKLNKFDHLAGRCDEEDIGRTIEHFFAECNRLWLNRRFTNCLPDKDSCPIWQDFFSRSGDERRAYQPRDVFAFNALDMDEPQKGIQVIETSAAVFLGERDSTGKKIGLGIIDFYQGFRPGEEGEEADEDEEEAEYASTVPKKDALWDALLGQRGRDIILKFKMGKLFGRDALKLNHDAENGAVVLRKEAACETVEKHFLSKIKDVFMDPKFFPGYSMTGPDKHLWVHASEFEEFVAPEDTGDEEPTTRRRKPADEDTSDEDTGDEDTGDEETIATEEEKKKAKKRRTKAKAKTKRKSKKKSKIEKGARIVALDKRSEDNSRLLPEKDWKRYNGVFDRYDTANDNTPLCFVLLRPEDQDDDELKAILTEAHEAADKEELERGGPFFEFPVDCVLLNNEE